MIRNGYQDDPGNFGVETISNEVVEQYCIAAADAGIPVAIHAIGDGAVEQVLDAYRACGWNQSTSHSIVHCQITDRFVRTNCPHGNSGASAGFSDYDMQIVNVSDLTRHPLHTPHRIR